MVRFRLSQENDNQNQSAPKYGDHAMTTASCFWDDDFPAKASVKYFNPLYHKIW